MGSKSLRYTLAASTAVVLAWIYTPLLLVVLNSFNTSKTFAWPPPGYTTEWWSRAIASSGAREAVWVSVRVASIVQRLSLPDQLAVSIRW